MPQATEEMRAKMREYFGDDGVCDSHALKFLRENGLNDKGGHFKIPHDMKVDSKIINCLCFLVAEWDYDFSWEGRLYD
jgi:hypothetical protein